jgi:hypothetical protein
MAKLSKELEQASERADTFEESVKALTVDELSKTPLLELEPQTKLSQRELNADDGIVLKPERSINSKEPFNEKFRKEYEFKDEKVAFIAEHKEIIGEAIEIWTKPYPGLSAHFWRVPTNKKVWGPRYLAEQISRKFYNRLTTENVPVSSEGGVTYVGQLVATNKIARLDAKPVRDNRKSSFSSNF